MIITLDLSFIPENVRSIIIDSEEIKSFAIERSSDAASIISTTSAPSSVMKQHDNKTIISTKESLENFKITLQNILARNHLENFIIAEDTEAENTVTILRQGDLEQFGIYVCKHCGTISKSIDEKILHERIHYFM